MTILTDAAGNYYVGKAEKKEDRQGITSDTYFAQFAPEIYSILSQVGASSLSQSTIYNQMDFSTSSSFVFRSSQDTRSSFRFGLYPYYTSTSIHFPVYDVAGVYRNPTESTTAQQATYVTGYAVASPNAESLGVLREQELPTGEYNSIFVYLGKLKDVNPDPRYSDYGSTIVAISAGSDSFTSTDPSTMQAFYRRAGSLQQWTQIYKTGDAMYSVSCLNGETVQSLHVTDWIVFENDPAEDYPYMGRVENLLLGYGAFNPQTVYEINPLSSGVAVDGGSNFYLPVGRFGDRTILMRIGNPNQ